MKPSRKEAEQARQRALQYEASMAVEGLHATREGRANLDYIDEQRMGHEEGVQYMFKRLREHGIIPEQPGNETDPS